MTGAVSDAYYLFFRRSCLRQQARFVELTSAANTPRVLLHGNPHVDNFAKTHQGEAMIDFDRSRQGPYTWDIVRFLCSISLRREDVKEEFLPKAVLKALEDGYVEGFERAYKKLDLPQVLPSKGPRSWERSMRDYLAANRKWAMKLRREPLFPSHPVVQELVRLYFEGRYEASRFRDYQVVEAGLAAGSLGKPRILVVLESVTGAPGQDPVLLDLKEVYQDPDTEYFFNPYVHHGLRMIEASHLYAPGMEQMLSFMTFRGRQYWGRKVPSFKAKLKGNLSRGLLETFAWSVGAQLGRGHRRSLRETAPEQLIQHFREGLHDFVAAGRQLNIELVADWERSQAWLTCLPQDGGADGSESDSPDSNDGSGGAAASGQAAGSSR